MNREERTIGAMLGLACGDALGAPLEFQDRASNLKKHGGELREMVGGGGFGWAPGEWTDDTGMALAVANGIIKKHREPVKPIGALFQEWRKTTKDCGSSIGAVLSAKKNNPWQTWYEAAQGVAKRNAPRNASNGSLMRTLPVALAYPNKETMLQRSAEISAMTHWNAEVETACAFYNLWVANVLAGMPLKDAYYMAIIEADHHAMDGAGLVAETLYDQLPGGAGWFDRLNNIEDLKYADLQPSGYAGYVVECFEAAAWCVLNTDNFEDCIVMAANLGGEADTIAAIAGGVAGAFYGHSAIPARWLAKLHQGGSLTCVAEQLHGVAYAQAVVASGQGPTADNPTIPSADEVFPQVTPEVGP